MSPRDVTNVRPSYFPPHTDPKESCVRPMNGRSKARITDLGVFAALEPADRKWLLKTARPMTFPVGATLQEAGSVDRRVFVVIEGMVRLDSG